MQGDRARRRIGMLTPSSNTVLEPMATEILRGLPQASVHFSRLRVTQISLEDAALQQFNLDAHLCAARLLADARVDVIGWNGTSASWTGFEGDERLCAEIERTHDVAATTAVLAINELLEILEVRRFALVSPYIGAVQRRIIETYGRAGYECVAERRFRRAGQLRICRNRGFADRGGGEAGLDGRTGGCRHHVHEPSLCSPGRRTGGGARSARSRFGRRLRLEGGSTLRNRHRKHHRLGAFVQSGQVRCGRKTHSALPEPSTTPAAEPRRRGSPASGGRSRRGGRSRPLPCSGCGRGHGPVRRCGPAGR